MYGFEIRKNTNNEGILMPEVVSVLAAHGTRSVRAADIDLIFLYLYKRSLSLSERLLLSMILYKQLILYRILKEALL